MKIGRKRKRQKGQQEYEGVRIIFKDNDWNFFRDKLHKKRRKVQQLDSVEMTIKHIQYQ